MTVDKSESRRKTGTKGRFIIIVKRHNDSFIDESASMITAFELLYQDGMQLDALDIFLNGMNWHMICSYGKRRAEEWIRKQKGVQQSCWN